MVEFIADVGTSWMGDYELLDYMVSRLKGMGATAFKPQIWPQSIYKGHMFEKEALRSTIDNRAIKKIENIAARHNLEAFYSVFDHNSLKRVVLNTDAKRVKFAHSMRTEGELIYRAIQQEKFKQVIISVDGWMDYLNNVLSSIHKYAVVEGYEPHMKDKIKLLYCVPNYPTTIDEVHFKNRMEILTGFSDHTTGLLAPIVAVARGATMIEKHVMCNRDEYLLYLGRNPEFPDKVCSISLDKFRLMIAECRAAEEMIS